MRGMDQDLASRSISQLFEFSRHGLLWLDSGLRVISCNPIAHGILAQNDGVRLRDQRLVFSRSDIARELEKFASRSRRSRMKEPGTETRLIRRIERPSGHGTLLLAGALINESSTEQSLMLLLEDLEAHPPLDSDVCQLIYGLTPAETRIAARLLDGRSLPGIALDLGLSPLTVRTHIKRVFKKVGVRSQAQLMAALCRVVFLPLWVATDSPSIDTIERPLPHGGRMGTSAIPRP